MNELRNSQFDQAGLEEIAATCQVTFDLTTNQLRKEDLGLPATARSVPDLSVDGTINDTAEATQDVSNAVRHMQSGNIRSYAGWIAIGAGAVLLYMIWAGVR